MQDFLQQELIVGDYVAGMYSDNETPAIFIVTGFTAKKVRLERTNSESGTSLKFPADLLKLDTADVEKMLLRVPRDRLGVELSIGDSVFASGGEYIDPVILRITEFIGDSILYERVVGSSHVYGGSRYTHDVIKIDASAITMMVLKEK